ncbi:MAG: hypothetical protein JW882_22215 [Deltaproteobacteria bacterium]|nr:hypothetical protein [Deltaproteobacteria bacterium]
MVDECSELTGEEKRQKRFDQWLSPENVCFRSTEAEKLYKERVTRLINALLIKEPDRVPVSLPSVAFPAYYAGATFHSILYDYNELRRSWIKFMNDFELDIWNSPRGIPGKAYELMDYKLYKWPGHGLPVDADTFQFIESEYMKSDEYDALIRDPSDFMTRVMMPRIFGSFESYRNLKPSTSIYELPTDYFIPFTRPDVRTSIKSLLDIGTDLSKWMEAVGECNRLAKESGIPSMGGGTARAPFDRIGDTLRGTKGIILDMYRNPEKLLEALDVIADVTIQEAISAVNTSGGIMVGFPLHKGADEFMSNNEFEKFYWPTLRKIIVALADEGIMTSLFAEGTYNNRLDIVKDIPKGWVLWRFEQTDMAMAKKALGNISCISGNVPPSLLYIGTPKEIKDYCRELIEVCADGGGYMLAGAAGANNINPDNLRAMTEAVKEYGLYK